MRCERPQSSISRPGSADGHELAQLAQVDRLDLAAAVPAGRARPSGGRSPRCPAGRARAAGCPGESPWRLVGRRGSAMLRTVVPRPRPALRPRRPWRPARPRGARARARSGRAWGRRRWSRAGRPPCSPSVISAPRSAGSRQPQAAQVAVRLAPVVEPRDRLLADVAALREAHGALVDARLLRHRVRVHVEAEPRPAGLDPDALRRLLGDRLHVERRARLADHVHAEQRGHVDAVLARRRTSAPPRAARHRAARARRGPRSTAARAISVTSSYWTSRPSE